jgi:RNA polymerase sigma-70 factor (ECF subfamily)
MTGEPFDAFVRRHERMVRALARSYVRDASAADDIAQEAFIKAHRALDTLADPAKEKTWLYAIARNAALDWLRREKRHRMEELNVDVAAPERRDSGGDLAARVMRIVDTLREDYRQVVLLRFVDELSYAEIGEALGLAPSAVGEKLHRVRKMVVERLKL